MTTDREKLLQARAEGFHAVTRLFAEAAEGAKRHGLQQGEQVQQQVLQKHHVPAGGL